MSRLNHYIFRSGDVFLSENNELPDALPAEFESAMEVSFDLDLYGEASRAVLLSDVRTKQEVVSASVSGTGDTAGPDSVPGWQWIKLRTLLASDDPVPARIARGATRAVGLLNWRRTHRFCGRCGSPTAAHETQIALVCTGCKAVVFPRLSPAVIVLVRKEGKILLARHAERNQDVYSCLAGYVEHGETLEECVSREVFEETGLEVQNIRYAGSQSWPYPDQYMIAFYADWKAGEIRVDPAEILEACWFDRSNLPNYPRPGTVAWRLINGVFPQ